MEEDFLVDLKKLATEGPCRVAIDVGANRGEWTQWLAEHFDHVLAVEPAPPAIERLRQIPHKNVHIVEAACASKHGVADFHVRSCVDQSSLLDAHPIGGVGQVEVPIAQTISVTTLPLDFLRFIASDKFGCADIDFVKIDVEGSEGDVLAGATPELFRGTRWLIEVHDRAEDVGHELARLGHDGIRVTKHPLEGAHPNHFWVFAPGSPDQ